MLNKNVETFLGCDGGYEESEIVLFGAPYDSTTSFRPGTRFASRAMRGDSYGLETYSPYQDRDMQDIRVFDGGDLELCFGNSEKALAKIEDFAARILNDEKVPCMIGGEHLVTLGAVRAAAKRFPDLSVIHFDAHADLRQDYLSEQLSHACVMRRVWEQVGDGRIFQFGIRSGDRSEFRWGRGRVTTRKFDFFGLAETVEKLKGKPVYLTIDLDVLDPSFFPGTGTPEPGGVSFMELLNAVLTAAPLQLVGCDLVELSPAYDSSGVSTVVACKILRELLLAMTKRT